MRSIDQLNPYLSFRAGQREAIEDILQEARDGAHIIQLDAGVGSGKSLILAVAARALLQNMSDEARAIYTTPQVKLVEQLRTDERLNIPALVGKANYPCNVLPGGEFTADTCPLPSKLRRQMCPMCPYEVAKSKFKAAKLGAITLDKLLFDKSLPSADILIIDESSGIEEKLIKQSEISLPYHIHRDSLVEDLEKWEADTAAELESASSRQMTLGLRVFESQKEEWVLGDAVRASRKVKSLELQLRKIEYLLGILAEGQEYILDKERKFRTIDGRRQFAKLANGPAVVLLASGTPCPQMVAREYSTVAMPNPIPADRRLVYFDPVGKMSAAEREKTIDKMAPKIAALHKEHGHNTLVHCHSYPCSELLANALMDEGVGVACMDKANKDRKEEIIKSWMRGDGTILTSVGCEEGLDLKGPKFPANVIAVVPFAFRGDEWVLKREEVDKKLPYHQQHGVMSTAIAIQQATGRTTRGPDDFSKTYILDSNFAWFVRRYRQAFKRDFLSSVMVAAPAVEAEA